MIEVAIFRGDLSDISAETAALTGTLAAGSFLLQSTSHFTLGCSNVLALPTAMASRQSVLPFSKLNKLFFGYFDPENVFLDNENKYVSG